jgi:hypothetical protein
MHKVWGGALAALLLLFVGTGHAVLFQDVWNPAPDIFLNTPNETYSFFHDLTDNGFHPNTSTITSAAISLTFYDDQDHLFGLPDLFDLIQEQVSFTFDGVSQSQQEIDTGTVHFLVNTQLLQSDGQVQVTLRNLAGDVYFDQSTLTAQATPESLPTPEPGSLCLIGTGLAGLGVLGKKRRGAKQAHAL